jgi:hypothetical protein
MWDEGVCVGGKAETSRHTMTKGGISLKTLYHVLLTRLISLMIEKKIINASENFEKCLCKKCIVFIKFFQPLLTSFVAFVCSCRPRMMND